MVHISALYTYPVKSCAGIRHDRADLDGRGLALDRQWMVIDPASRFVTQREYPRLALARTALSGQSLILTAPDLPPLAVPVAEHEGSRREVVVWKDTCLGIDEGDAAADWFCGWLPPAVHLGRQPGGFEPAPPGAWYSAGHDGSFPAQRGPGGLRAVCRGHLAARRHCRHPV